MCRPTYLVYMSVRLSYYKNTLCYVMLCTQDVENWTYFTRQVEFCCSSVGADTVRRNTFVLPEIVLVRFEYCKVTGHSVHVDVGITDQPMTVVVPRIADRSVGVGHCSCVERRCVRKLSGDIKRRNHEPCPFYAVQQYTNATFLVPILVTVYKLFGVVLICHLFVHLLKTDV